MIYKSDVTAIAESEFETLLESVEDRFENSTMAEAAAVVVGEQEANWTTFMQSVGLSELAAYSEGKTVEYVGERLKSFVETAKKWFEKLKEKIAEITKAFMNKVTSFANENMNFVKKYEKALKDASVPADFEFKGYTFKNLDNVEYGNSVVRTVNNPKEILDKDLTKEAAHKALFKSNNPGVEGNLNTQLRAYFYGDKEKKALNIDVKEQLDILRETKDMKKQAWSKFTQAAKDITGIIKELNRAEKVFSKEHKKDESEGAQDMQKAFNTLIAYWKAYGMGVLQMHTAYLGALGNRNRQAKAICVKLIMTNKKAEHAEKKAAKKEEKPEVKTEGFVNTEAFLGAIEFI